MTTTASYRMVENVMKCEKQNLKEYKIGLTFSDFDPEEHLIMDVDVKAGLGEVGKHPDDTTYELRIWGTFDRLSFSSNEVEKCQYSCSAFIPKLYLVETLKREVKHEWIYLTWKSNKCWDKGEEFIQDDGVSEECIEDEED
jgi:hypothetical protein